MKTIMRRGLCSGKIAYPKSEENGHTLTRSLGPQEACGLSGLSETALPATLAWCKIEAYARKGLSQILTLETSPL